MRKKGWVIVGILVSIPIVLLIGLAVFLGPIVRIAVEKGGSAALKVPTRLQSASISLRGKVTLTGLSIDNPPGFSDPRAVAFERLDSRIQMGSLLGSPVEVDHLTIVKPALSLDFEGTKSNWSVLQENLSSGAASPQKKEEEARGKKFMIHRLRIEGGVARFRSSLISGGVAEVSLPPIEIENVGTAEGGVSLGEVLGIVLRALGQSSVKAGQGVVPPELIHRFDAEIQNKLKQMEELPGPALEDLKKKLDKLKDRAPQTR